MRKDLTKFLVFPCKGAALLDKWLEETWYGEYPLTIVTYEEFKRFDMRVVQVRKSRFDSW